MDTTPSTGSLRVQYAYSNDVRSRLVSMTYPNERVLMYKYDGSTVDSAIGRLSYLGEDDGAGGVRRLEEYSYLGLSTIVKRAHTQPHVDLTYIKQTGESNGAAGDQYAGLDRFDRVVDQRWIKTSNTTSTDRFKYGYDENGNVMYKDNTLSSSNSELYHANGATAGYDNLNRLTGFQRGTLNTAKDSISGAATHTQSWNLDPLGNWDGASGVTTDGAAQSRTHNRRNQATAVGGATLTFDNNGNTTKDENGYTYIYDAWNRLVKESIQNVAQQDKHGYDALGRRITTGNSANTIPDLYYSDQWQVLEERSGSTVKDQYVWSIAYVDAMVLRDRDAASGGDLGKTGSGLDERLYVQQDANYNVTALVDISGAVVERFIYDPYGSVTVLDSSWAVKNDGAVADSDFNWVYLHQGGRFDDAGFGGLYSFERRYYSPTLGRWMQQDPTGYVDGLGLYSYLGEAPIARNDPSGLAQSKPDWWKRFYRNPLKNEGPDPDNCKPCDCPCLWDSFARNMAAWIMRSVDAIFYDVQDLTHPAIIVRSWDKMTRAAMRIDKECGGGSPPPVHFRIPVPVAPAPVQKPFVPLPVKPFTPVQQPWWAKGGAKVTKYIDVTAEVSAGVTVTIAVILVVGSTGGAGAPVLAPVLVP